MWLRVGSLQRTVNIIWQYRQKGREHLRAQPTTTPSFHECNNPVVSKVGWGVGGSGYMICWRSHFEIQGQGGGKIKRNRKRHWVRRNWVWWQNHPAPEYAQGLFQGLRVHWDGHELPRQRGGPREKKARSGGRNERAVANSGKGGGQSIGVILTQKAQRAQTLGTTELTSRLPRFPVMGATGEQRQQKGLGHTMFLTRGELDSPKSWKGG